MPGRDHTWDFWKGGVQKKLMNLKIEELQIAKIVILKLLCLIFFVCY